MRHEIRGLATFLCGLKEKEAVNGDPLWSHQKALIFEMMNCILSARSILMVEGPGLGKTRIQGIRIGVLADLMERGLLTGNILILVKRKSIVMQQALGSEGKRDVMMLREHSLVRNREMREQCKYVEQQLGVEGERYFPLKIWMSLCEESPRDPRETTELLQRSLKARDCWEEFQRIPNAFNLLSDAALLLSRHAVTVYGPNEQDLELLEVTPPSEEKSGKKGDLLFGVSDTMLPHVWVQSEFDIRDVQEEKLPSESTRIAVMSWKSLNQHRARLKIASFLKNVRWIFVDEAGTTSDNGYTEVVTHEDIGGEEPHLLASAAFNRYGRLQYEATLSEMSVEDGMNSPERILRPHRLVGFPGNDEILYPSGSYEAAEQFIAFYGRQLQLPKEQRAPQFHEGPHLAVFNPKQVPYVVMRLREEFGHMGIKFVSYDANRDEEHSGRIQLRMDDPVHQKTCLISCMENVIDSFDWTRLRATFLCTQETSAELEYQKRLFGRQFHTRETGGYVIQQRFADVDTHNRLVWKAYKPDISIPESGSFHITPGQHFLGKRECQREGTHLAKGNPPRTELWASLPAKFFRENANLAEGTFPPSITEQRGHMPSLIVVFPPLRANSRSIDRSYLREFALANGLDADIWMRDLYAVLHRAGTQVQKQCEALEKKVLEIRLSRAVAIVSNRTHHNMREAEQQAMKPPWITPRDIAAHLGAVKQAAGKKSHKKMIEQKEKSTRRVRSRPDEEADDTMDFHDHDDDSEPTEAALREIEFGSDDW